MLAEGIAKALGRERVKEDKAPTEPVHAAGSEAHRTCFTYNMDHCTLEWVLGGQ